MKAKFRETASELETARQMLYDCQIYYRSEVERSRAFESGMNLQRHRVLELRNRYQGLYAEQDRVNAELRHRLRIAEEAIEGQKQELVRYATLPQIEQSEISRPDQPQYIPRGVDFMEGGDIQHGLDPAFETQLDYSAGDGQTSANTHNAPFPATEFPTSAVRDEPSSGTPMLEIQGQKRGLDGQGNPTAKKQRGSKR
jgi:hypothetical protein